MFEHPLTIKMLASNRPRCWLRIGTPDGRLALGWKASLMRTSERGLFNSSFRLPSADRSQMPDRTFPPPWSFEEHSAYYVVRGRNGQRLAYIYYENEPGRRSAAKLLSKDEARTDCRELCKAAGAGRQDVAPNSWHPPITRRHALPSGLLGSTISISIPESDLVANGLHALLIEKKKRYNSG